MIEENTKIRLKFSEIAEALRDGRVEMDGDGLLLVSDDLACTGRIETSGCAGLKIETVYRLAVGALSTLMHRARSMNPKAMAALAEWYAVGELDESMGGGIREVSFSRGEKIVGHVVPVLNELGQPTMWDLIRKTPLKKYSDGDFIAGIDTQAQLNNMLRKLPDRSGQEVGTLQVRLAEALQTEANLAALDAMVAKNWEISQAA